MMRESWCNGNLSSVVANFALISSFESHISTDSPGGSPWVFDLPVLVGCIASHRHSMVNLAKPIAFFENSWTIVLEGWIGAKCNRCWALLDQISQFSTLPVLGCLVACNFDRPAMVIRGTASVGSPIGYLWFSSNSLVIQEHVVINPIHPSAVATIVVSFHAIYHLLLRKVVTCAGFDEVRWFNHCNCREGPAGSTLPLVFDSRHLSFGFPVNRSHTNYWVVFGFGSSWIFLGGFYAYWTFIFAVCRIWFGGLAFFSLIRSIIRWAL